LRADVASAGRHPNGGTLNTFNPLFPRGAYFGPKLTMFGPFNFFDFHPFLMFSPLPNVSCALDSGWFWRQSLRWALDLHTTIVLNLAGFLTGEFLKDTGPSNDVAFSNVGVTYRF
jgi:hypothetical protein